MKRVISFILIISVVFLTTVSSVYAENRTGTVPDGGSLPADASSTGAALPDELPADTGLPGNPSHSGKRNAAGEPDGGRRLENIDFFTDGLYETVNISAPGFTDYYITELADPARIVIDLVDLDVPEGQGIIRTDGAYVKRIRYAQFTERIARVVLDVNEGYDFSIVRTDTGLTAYVREHPAPEELRKDGVIPLGPEYGISASGHGMDETVTIALGGYDGYSISRRTDPERLVVTIPEAYVSSGAKRFDYGGERISSLEYAAAGRSGAEITISLNAQFRYRAELSDGKLVISFSWPTYKNIIYHNSGDRIYFLIKNAALTKGTKDLKPLYTASADESGRVWTVTFPSQNADLGEGVLDINDEYLESFEVKNNGDGTTSLIFTGRRGNSYLVYTRDSGDTAITVVRPARKDQRIVVIDAGHGGTATGARYGDLYEKDLNLDIARRLESLLKSKGVQTYMIRSDDSNVDNYERAYIANMLGASLYLSIHNNAAGKSSVKGTMTLCYPSTKSGFTGRQFAQIIQERMVAALKTTDLKVRLRPDLIVLRETYMPAALAEVAFMTNRQDRENLRNGSFRQTAAEALCGSVMEALEKIA
ncbi:MAG TPA: N-acetylmuramoyl-L-alanine amidase [Clostridiales bacterium]|nr:N-acetylmuramoyl-L-alanine amidase [Clostridiales bacterium]